MGIERWDCAAHEPREPQAQFQIVMHDQTEAGIRTGNRLLSRFVRQDSAPSFQLTPQNIAAQPAGSLPRIAATCRRVTDWPKTWDVVNHISRLRHTVRTVDRAHEPLFCEAIRRAARSRRGRFQIPVGPFQMALDAVLDELGRIAR